MLVRVRGFGFGLGFGLGLRYELPLTRTSSLDLRRTGGGAAVEPVSAGGSRTGARLLDPTLRRGSNTYLSKEGWARQRMTLG